MSTPGFLQQMLANERELFVKVANAVLEEGADHRPDPKSRSSRELIGHLIGHNLDLVELAEDGVIHHRNQVEYDSIADGVRRLDET